MKIDTQIGHHGLAAVPDDARAFERMGFDGAWTFEAGHDPFLPVVLGATATTRLEFGTNIAVAFGRTPFATAQVVWDLQKASGGRFHLGLGAQVRAHIERRYSMPYDPPVPRLVDYVGCLRAIWKTYQTGARPTYEGRFYRFQLMNPMFNPGPIDHPDIPIWLAGVNPGMCRAAGEVANGFHVHPMHSIPYLRNVVIPAIEEGARRAGRTRADVQLYSPVFAVTGDTQDERDRSLEEIRKQISFYGSTPSYKVVLEQHDELDTARKLSESARQGKWAEMPKLISDKLLEQIAIVAPPADLPRAIRRRYDGLFDRVSLYFPIRSDEPEAAWKGFVDAFRAAG